MSDVHMAKAALWAALIGLTACGGSSAPGSPSAPAPAPPVAPPPTEFAVGDERVVLGFRKGAAGIRFVESIVVGSEIVFPPQCDAPTPPASGLCSLGHRELRSDSGYGKDLKLVGTHARGQQLDLLFAAVFEGSPECGAYGYWLLRVDPRGARATSPIVGCLTTPFPEGPDREYPNPVIQWEPSVGIRVLDSYSGWLGFELDARTLEWTQVAGEGDAP